MSMFRIVLARLSLRCYYSTFAPMIDLPERDWWFRGYLHSAPNTGGELMELPAGKSISTIMACHFAVSITSMQATFI